MIKKAHKAIIDGKEVTVTWEIPEVGVDITKEERERRAEHFSDVFAYAFDEKGYAGCKFDSDTNTFTRYWD